MCGFTGIFNIKLENSVDENRLVKMTDAIIERGPDDFGYYCEGPIGLGFRRLSILDISNSGHQPFQSSDLRYTLVFNGEIYNFKEFYNDLELRGYRFRSKSDTEVLLYLLIEYGEQALDKLNGMFAFCLWDRVKNEVLLGRDRYGVKPLYYCILRDEIVFGSEPKSILNAGVNFDLNDEIISEWILFRYIAGENTINKNVKKLLPGYILKISNGNVQIKRWYNLSERILNHTEISNPVEWFEETFQSALNYRMVSDVPVGILLSGGLDSSSVAGTLKKMGYIGMKTFNVGFGDFILDESKMARRYSNDLGFEFHSKQFFGETLRKAIIESTIALDEPIMHGNEPQIYAISSYANNHVKVLLSGEGADELMGGYVRYEPLKRPFLSNTLSLLLQLIPNKLKSQRYIKLQNYIIGLNKSERVIFNGCNFFPKEIESIMDGILKFDLGYRDQILKEAKLLYPDKPARQVLYLDQHTYLQSLNDRNDRNTMRASIECREPFQDYRLVEGIGSMSNSAVFGNGKSKYLLRSAMTQILPEYIQNFKKIGFVPPIQKYVEEDSLMKESFSNLKNSRIFDLPVLSEFNKNLLFDNPLLFRLKQQLWFFHLWYKHQLNEELF